MMTCGDPAYVATVCEPYGEGEMAIAGRMARWMGEPGEQDPTLVYFGQGDSEIAAALLHHSPSVRLLIFDFQGKHYTVPRTWRRFLLLPGDTPRQLNQIIAAKRKTLSFPIRTGSGDRPPRWYTLTRLRPTDTWPPKNPHEYLEQLKDRDAGEMP